MSLGISISITIEYFETLKVTRFPISILTICLLYRINNECYWKSNIRKQEI
ncbi:hypothetical protein [Brachyspira murdochii]|uniref:hypothetical protein n=1 Tax=Brachyspira murdochii TaxID=84378 RepID=UPI002156FE30|nr:hypothetical protein [Brachyspira murdochii]